MLNYLFRASSAATGEFVSHWVRYCFDDDTGSFFPFSSTSFPHSLEPFSRCPCYPLPLHSFPFLIYPGTVAGLRPILNVPGLENVDVTDKIAGHMSYRVYMPVILEELGFRVTESWFDEVEEVDFEGEYSSAFKFDCEPTELSCFLPFFR